MLQPNPMRLLVLAFDDKAAQSKTGKVKLALRV
jgi:hypothetical protein